MNFEQAKKDIEQWIVEFVEKPNPLLNGWAPCPYARQARLNDRVEIRQGCFNPIDDLKHIAMGERDVIAYVYGRERWGSDEFNQLVKTANMTNLSAQGLIALADHPDDVESVTGVIMNQGTYAIVFVQDMAKLDHFAKTLADKGFYKDWPEDYLQVLFEGRQDPR
jgi:hypothetical protein